MKRSYIAGIVALSFGLSSQALAKDVNPLDIFEGDFAAVGSVDVQKLAANKMLDDLLSKHGQKRKVDDALKTVKDNWGVDIKKDIASISFAYATSGKDGCFVVDATKSIPKLQEILAGDKSSIPGSEKAIPYKDQFIFPTENGEANWFILSDKRVLGCTSGIDIKPSIDNALAAKPKTLKEKSAKLEKMYAQTVASSDIRLAGVMTSSMRKDVETYQLDGENGKALALKDYDAAAISIGFAKGLDVAIVGQAKSEDVAKVGADILIATTSELAPQLDEMELGFVMKALKISSSKKNLKVDLKLSKADIVKIMDVVVALTSDSGAQQPK